MLNPKFDIKSVVRTNSQYKGRKFLQARRGIKPALLIESEYFSFIKNMLAQIQRRFENVVLDGIDVRVITKSIHDADFTEAYFNRLMGMFKGMITSQYSAPRIMKAVKLIINKADKAQKEKFSITIERSFGVDISGLPEFEGYRTYMNNAIKRNFQLIKSIRGENMDALETMLRTAIEKGTSIEEMQKQINEIYFGNKGRKKAVLIARNEIKNITSMLNEKRLRNAGFDMYIWSNSQDRAVRGNPSGLYPKSKYDHWIMEGKICRFDDPTTYSNDGKRWYKRSGKMPIGEPGDEINCRCLQIPYLDLEQ